MRDSRKMRSVYDTPRRLSVAILTFWIVLQNGAEKKQLSILAMFGGGGSKPEAPASPPAPASTVVDVVTVSDSESNVQPEDVISESTTLEHPPGMLCFQPVPSAVLQHAYRRTSEASSSETPAPFLPSPGQGNSCSCA